MTSGAPQGHRGFYVDLLDNGVWHDVGLGSVAVHDISGLKPLSYGVWRDFSPYRKLCFSQNLVKVRAILSWNAAPPPNQPGYTPVWGNVLDFEVQIRPRPFIFWADFLRELQPALKLPLPETLQPLLRLIDPHAKLPVEFPDPPSLAEQMLEYRKAGIPIHRFAFLEAQKLIQAPALAAEASPLQKYGLAAAEIDGIIGKLIAKSEGDRAYEELTCIGLKPESDLLEAVFTVKQKLGYSGALCGPGSTEYVAFWADFNDGNGFVYLGTAAQNVHDFSQITAAGLQYAVSLKRSFADYLQPCDLGARVVRLRATLSWQTPPPPGNPDWNPVWGNRKEALVQLRLGEGAGRYPLIITVGDVPVDQIGDTTGEANGHMLLAGVSLTDSPFGGQLAITGSIGGPGPWKYRIEVARDGTSDWHALTNTITVKKVMRLNGFAVACAPGEYVCDVVLTPTDDGDGRGPGWYEYIEDLSGASTVELVDGLLGRWYTDKTMEGMQRIRLTAKNSAGTLFPAVEEVRVWIDNSAPRAAIAITGATFGGVPVPAVDCGKFKQGTIIEGTFSSSDPGVLPGLAIYQHFGSASFDISPALAGNVPLLTSTPATLSYPLQPTTGVSGTWRLDTSQMKACGYVLRLNVYDRTNVNSQGVSFWTPAEVGFCIE